ESLSCIFSLQALYITHYSGRPMFSFNIFDEVKVKKDVLSPVFTAINQMAETIRVDKKKIHRLILDDDSEMVLVTGKYIGAFLIVNEYHSIFNVKLKKLIDKIETNELESVKHWMGENERFNKKIMDYLKEIF
ncbi:MAG: hypothetical protein ACFFCS_20850, partial [Candidatus Hodarchaeota archaeon]